MIEEIKQQFLKECIKKGKASVTDMISESRAESASATEELNKLIKQIDFCKAKIMAHKSLLRQFGAEEENKKTLKIYDTKMSWEQLPDNYKEMCLTVCRMVSKNKITVNEIKENMSSDLKDIYFIIKWLWDNKIIERNTSDPTAPLSKGKDYDYFMKKENI